MKNVKLFVGVLVLAFLASVTQKATAQLQSPSPSPAGYVSQTVGFTKISIDYSSPGVKGRKVFGELEKYGVSWRAGANGPTMIEFSTGVSIGGKNIGAGKYSLFITPMQTGEWTIHLNSKGNAVFAYMKDDKIDEAALALDDAATIKVTPVMATESMERLAYAVSAQDNKVAKVTMAWDKVRLSFVVDTMVSQKLEGFTNTLK